MPVPRVVPIETSYWVDGELVSRTSSTATASRDLPPTNKSVNGSSGTQSARHRDSRSSPNSSHLHRTVYDISKGKAVPVEVSYLKRPKSAAVEPRSTGSSRPKDPEPSGTGDRYIRVQVPRESVSRHRPVSASMISFRNVKAPHPDKSPVIHSADSDFGRPRIRIERDVSPRPREVKQTTSTRNNLGVDDGSGRSGNARQSGRSSSREFRDDPAYSSYDDRPPSGREPMSMRSPHGRTARDPPRQERARYRDDFPEMTPRPAQRYYVDDGHLDDEYDRRYGRHGTKAEDRQRGRLSEAEREPYDSRSDARDGRRHDSDRDVLEPRQDERARDGRREDSDRDHGRGDRQRDIRMDDSDLEYSGRPARKNRPERSDDHFQQEAREPRRSHKDDKAQDSIRDRSSDRDRPKSRDRQRDKSRDRGRSRSRSRSPDRKKDKPARLPGGLASLLPAVMNLGATAAFGGGMSAAISGGEELLKKYLNKDRSDDEDSDEERPRRGRDDSDLDEKTRTQEKHTDRHERRSGRESERDVSDRDRDSSRRRHQRDRDRDRDRDRERNSDRERGDREDRDRDRERERDRKSKPRSDRRERTRERRQSHGEGASDHSPSPAIEPALRRPRRRVHHDESHSDDDPNNGDSSAMLDPDEDYRRRLQEAQGAASSSAPPVVPTADGGRDGEPMPVRARAASASAAGVPTPSPPFGGRQIPLFDDGAIESPSDVSISAQTDDNVKPRPRVRIVEPSEEKPKEKEIKGILKQPKDKFPEDPHYVREGVAPLKDHRNKSNDIPPGARWTKIDRRLVNPECLEQAQERFEERPDCVIVLRVLTKEEIQRFANKTRDIRDARHDPKLAEKLARRKREKEEARRRAEEKDDEESDDEKSASQDEGPRLLEASAASDGYEDEPDFVKEYERRRERERDPDRDFVTSRPREREQRENRERERDGDWK